MAAVRGLPQGHTAAHIAGRGQAPGRNERVVQRIQRQGRYSNVCHVRLGRGAFPVIVGVFKAMQRRGYEGAIASFDNAR